MDIQTEKELTVVLKEYYYCYNMWRSTPYIVSELIGQDCRNRDVSDYCNLCCALSEEDFCKIVIPLLVNDKVDMENFLIQKQYKCAHRRLPLSRENRLDAAENGSCIESTRKQMGVCLFLIVTLFTPLQAQEKTKALEYLICLFECCFDSTKRKECGEVIQEDTVLLRKRLLGEIGDNTTEWLKMVDHARVLFYQYTQKRKIYYGFLSNLINLNTNVPNDINGFAV